MFKETFYSSKTALSLETNERGIFLVIADVTSETKNGMPTFNWKESKTCLLSEQELLELKNVISVFYGYSTYRIPTYNDASLLNDLKNLFKELGKIENKKFIFAWDKIKAFFSNREARNKIETLLTEVFNTEKPSPNGFIELIGEEAYKEMVIDKFKKDTFKNYQFFHKSEKSNTKCGLNMWNGTLQLLIAKDKDNPSKFYLDKFNSLSIIEFMEVCVSNSYAIRAKLLAKTIKEYSNSK